MLEQALNYARRGWPVFPVHSATNGTCSCGRPDCRHPAKHPRTSNGFHDATTDEHQIREWWTQALHANIGIPTGRVSGILVIDVNPRNGGEARLHALNEEHNLPSILASQTEEVGP